MLPSVLSSAACSMHRSPRNSTAEGIAADDDRCAVQFQLEELTTVPYTLWALESRMLNCMPLRSTLVPAGFVILRDADASGPRSKQNQLGHNRDTIKSKLARRANLHVLDHTHPCMPCTSARVRASASRFALARVAYLKS